MIVDDGATLWYKDAVIYELHVRAFYDSNADGIGDFCGLTSKLDYLRDLGVTAIWLLPFYPSPLKDDGYDIADYTAVHPAYGTLRDFRIFLKEAHARGLKVITELVLNHTSDQHPWFQRARRAKKGSSWRNFYVWSDSPEKYQDARIIFQDFETSNWTWDPVANAYYWHRFYDHQPDLNFDNPRVRRAILNVVDFWLRLGVDGLRLDAVPYLFEREGTSGENLPQTHVTLRRLRRHIDEHFPGRMLLAEANQWPEEAAAYFGDGDECHMAFHFPLMPRLFMAVRMEDRLPIIDIMDQTPQIPETAQWVLFLRNHDELTLEMVSDEERIYMYRAYAKTPEARINLGIRRRLAPLLSNHRRKIELLSALLLSLPGTPVIYYGDEIGMGDNIYLGDRNGVRTPMQWSADRNAGFSRAKPQQLYLPLIVDHEYHHETVHVEAQQNNPHSLLNWMKRLIELRRRFKAFGRGSLEFLHPANRKVLAFTRRYAGEQILVVANLSRFVQHVELDLSGFQGQVPIEMFGRTRFPLIGELPYPLTLGPHAFCWFALEPQPVAHTSATIGQEPQAPTIAVAQDWSEVVLGDKRAALEDALPGYLRARSWFSARTRTLLAVRVVDHIAVPTDSGTTYIILARVDYADDEAQVYAIPLVYARKDQASWLWQAQEQAIIARLQRDGVDIGVLYDAMWSESFAHTLLQAIAGRRKFQGVLGTLVGAPTPELSRIQRQKSTRQEITTLQADHNNTSVIYGDQLILKLFRCIDEGVNPDLEIRRFLTRQGFKHTPPVAGTMEYRRSSGEPISLLILQGFVPNQGEAWDTTLAALHDYFDRIAAAASHEPPRAHPPTLLELLDLADQETPAQARELIGNYLDSARLLGQRTAELHLALSSDAQDVNFVPRPFTLLYQRSLYQSMRSLAGRVFYTLRRVLRGLAEPERDAAQAVLDRESLLFERFRSVATQKINALRIRCHGDYHLGQVLCTGDDFVIFDFEGEPDRPVIERRLKRSPLRDVAGMLQSFRYATYVVRLSRAAEGVDGWTMVAELEPWACLWHRWVGAAFLNAYLATAAQGSFLPPARAQIGTLLDIFTLEKAVQELGYELDNRPEWVRIPLLGLLELLETK
jgi:maltose alpha-D-glucosyltransferase/alpha-amylase